MADMQMYYGDQIWHILPWIREKFRFDFLPLNLAKKVWFRTHKIILNKIFELQIIIMFGNWCGVHESGFFFCHWFLKSIFFHFLKGPS